MEEALDQFALEIAVNNIIYLIEKKQKPNNNSKEYFEWVKDYFNSATKSLDTMINPHEKSYHFTIYLKELIECTGKELKRFSYNDALEVKAKLHSLSGNLDNLSKNVPAFYETNASRDMLKFFKDFLPKICT